MPTKIFGVLLAAMMITGMVCPHTPESPLTPNAAEEVRPGVTNNEEPTKFHPKISLEENIAELLNSGLYTDQEIGQMRGDEKKIEDLAHANRLRNFRENYPFQYSDTYEKMAPEEMKSALDEERKNAWKHGRLPDHLKEREMTKPHMVYAVLSRYNAEERLKATGKYKEEDLAKLTDQGVHSLVHKNNVEMLKKADLMYRGSRIHKLNPRSLGKASRMDIHKEALAYKASVCGQEWLGNWENPSERVILDMYEQKMKKETKKVGGKSKSPGGEPAKKKGEGVANTP